jgi:hypothetical protein
MSETKAKGSVISQIVVAVVVALLVGGTAPWWWKEVFPDQPTPTQEPGVAPQADSPESLSRTEASLPGDAILHFRIAEIQGRDLTVEIDYHYNAQHGDKVMVGAWLHGVASGYQPVFVPSPLEGTAQLQMSVSEPGMSTGLDIFLYEWGRPAEPFAQRTFPYQMRFE